MKAPSPYKITPKRTIMIKIKMSTSQSVHVDPSIKPEPCLGSESFWRCFFSSWCFFRIVVTSKPFSPSSLPSFPPAPAEYHFASSSTNTSTQIGKEGSLHSPHTLGRQMQSEYMNKCQAHSFAWSTSQDSSYSFVLFPLCWSGEPFVFQATEGWKESLGQAKLNTAVTWCQKVFTRQSRKP